MCLTEVTDIGSVLPVVLCMVSDWLHILTTHKTTGNTEPISVTSVKHNSRLPDDGPCEVRNMLE
jgi:hypothetical protein